MLDQYPVFDSHLHIINRHFPLVENQGFLPEEYSCDDYMGRMARYNLRGGAVVSGSFQAFDQLYLKSALSILGSNFFGVTQLPVNVPDSEIEALNKIGVKAVRFNLFRGGSESITELEIMANRIFDIAGWHIELYLDSCMLPALYQTLINLPKVSIDHLGLTHSGFSTLVKLVEKGVHVKASGFSRLDFDVRGALQTLNAANPSSLMFGSDLPSTRAPKKYSDDDFLVVLDALEEQDARRVLCKNALQFYGR